MLEIFCDPDSFGGPEDREPWADAARRLGVGPDSGEAFGDRSAEVRRDGFVHRFGGFDRDGVPCVGHQDELCARNGGCQ